MRFDKAQERNLKIIDRLITQRENRIVKEYAIALRDIRTELAVAYEKYAVGKELSYAEMTRYNRLANLEEDIFKRVNRLTGTTASQLKRGQGEIFAESYYRTAFLLETEVQAKLGFGQLNPNTIEAAVNNPLDKVGFLKRNRLNQDRLKAQLSSELTQGLIRGEAYQTVANRLTQRMNVGATSAKRIAATEMHRVQNQGLRSSFEHAENVGVEFRYFWVSAVDDKTREMHADMDGREADIVDGQAVFTLPDGVQTDSPGNTGIAEHDINCFPGTTTVYSPSEIERSMKRWYDGDLIEITTATGMKLAGTPNHPILTEKGWLPLNQINEGDNVISGTFGKKVSFGDPDPHNRPVTFHEAHGFVSVMGSAITKRISTVNPQFHGDGLDGDVDIVTLKSKLENGVKTFSFEGVGESDLAFADFSKGELVSDGSFCKFAFWSLLAPNSIMSGLGEGEALLGGSVGHSDKHGVASVSRGNVVFEENPPDNIPAKTEAFSDSLFAFAADVSPDKVVSVKISKFSGHVYNLQTEYGWYVANANVAQSDSSVKGIIAHNCRCGMRGEIAGYEPKFRRVRGEGIVPYQSYNQWYNARIA